MPQYLGLDFYEQAVNHMINSFKVNNNCNYEKADQNVNQFIDNSNEKQLNQKIIDFQDKQQNNENNKQIIIECNSQSIEPKQRSNDFTKG